MPKILSVGPDEVNLEKSPNVKVTDADFVSLVTSSLNKAVDTIEQAGLGTVPPSSLKIGSDGTVTISDEAVYDAIKKRLEDSSVVIFGNSGCLNVICGIL